jgi:hypothetical protein
MSEEQKSDVDHQQFWQMAIETWKASGLSVRQFCKNEGLSEPSFYSWRKKFTGSDNDEIEQESPKSQQSEFIEITIPSNNSSVVELVLTSGNILKIPNGIEAKTLMTIISVLHQTHLC